MILRHGPKTPNLLLGLDGLDGGVVLHGGLVHVVVDERVDVLVGDELPLGLFSELLHFTCNIITSSW